MWDLSFEGVDISARLLAVNRATASSESLAGPGTSQFVLRNHSVRSVGRPFPLQLELVRVCAPSPQQLSQSTRPPMDVFSATSAIVGLAVPVFQCAKALRDRIKLVRCPLHLLCTLRALMIILHPCLQVASEKSELLAALIEYEKDINLLESLYNDNKELLDQHKLDTDLKELAEYAWSCFPFAARSDDGAESYTTSING